MNISKLLGLNKYSILKDIPESILVQSYDINERYEFIGDTILNFITVNMIIRNIDVNQSDMEKIKSRIVKNDTLNCIMAKRNQCDRLGTKRCADRFESIIGGIYKYLSVSKNMGINAISILESYLIDEWNWNDLLYKSILEIDLSCNIESDKDVNVVTSKDGILSLKHFRPLSIKGKQMVLHDEVGFIRSKTTDKSIHKQLDSIEALIDETKTNKSLEKISNSLFKLASNNGFITL